MFRDVAVCAFLTLVLRGTAFAAQDVLARVRANGVVHCAGIVRPGIAVPSVDGKQWSGISPDVCRAIASAVLGDPNRITFRPYFRADPRNTSTNTPDDVVFLSSTELLGVGSGSATELDLGPVVVHDGLSLLVPASGPAHAAGLDRSYICVEPGSPADRALIRFFDRHEIALHEHPFQETDEMRQAYGDGKCDALAGPLSTLASVRADPEEGHYTDRILPESLADDPVFAATSGDARWARVVWWTFSALVDAEAASIGRTGVTDAPIPGVPPAIGIELGLPSHWAQAAVRAEGNYGEIFDRDMGAESRLKLRRAENDSIENGGSIFGLRIE